MYQIIINGIKHGHYNPNTSPAQTAKKMAKKIYVMNDMKGTQRILINFCLNRIIAQGGDKLYSYYITVYPVPETTIPRETLNDYLTNNPNELFKESKTNKELAKFLKKYVIKIKDKYFLKKFYLEVEKNEKIKKN